MRKILLILLAILFFFADTSYCKTKGYAGSNHSSNEVYVRGYTTKKGKKVQGHYRTKPNSTKLDNWSTEGNINPHTGRAGTKAPD